MQQHPFFVGNYFFLVRMWLNVPHGSKEVNCYSFYIAYEIVDRIKKRAKQNMFLQLIYICGILTLGSEILSLDRYF